MSNPAPKPNTPDPLRYKLAQEEGPRREAEQRAAATPMPGALREAFATVQDIKVGPYSFRPLTDWDVEVVQEQKHPLHEYFTQAFRGKEPNVEFPIRGPAVWWFLWLLSVPARQAYEAVRAGTDKDAAREGFAMLAFLELQTCMEACMRQVGVYFGTVVAYEPAKVEGESPPPPPQS